MDYNNVGQAGLKVSELSLGGWTTFGGTLTDMNLARDIIHTAYEGGITFFDIADIYARGGSEWMMGSVLKDFPRHTLVISTKVFWPMSDDPNDRGLSRKHIMESIDKSLHRIGTDYVDIYFCHRYDEETPLLETARAMDDLIRQGKILYWGTSEWPVEKIDEVQAICDKYGLHAPIVEQPQYNMVYRKRFEQEVAPTVKQHGMGTVIWSPLASGLLTGKYDEGVPEDSRLGKMEWLREHLYEENLVERVKQLKPIADDLGCTRAELAIAWALNHEAVTSVILGATKVEQVESNLRARDVAAEMTDDVMDAIDEVFEPDFEPEPA